MYEQQCKNNVMGTLVYKWGIDFPEAYPTKVVDNKLSFGLGQQGLILFFLPKILQILAEFTQFCFMLVLSLRVILFFPRY